ncbi:hypothetical protein ACIQLJ_00590 [Microbacterium sp. NPDC091313]
MSDGPADPVDADDVTLWAGRLRPWPAADAAAAEAAPEERTRVARRRGAAAPEPPVDGAAEPEHTVLRARTAPTTRRAASQRPPAAPEPAARVPDGATRETYGPRHAEPVVVTRRAPAPPRALTDETVPTATRPRLRAGWLVAGAVLVALIAAAAVAALLLVGA